MFQFGVASQQQELFLASQDVVNSLTDTQFILDEISRFQQSEQYKAMVDGLNYYDGRQSILKKQRTAIGDNNELVIIKNLPNNKIVDNQYQKMVDQKVNYLLGQPFVLQSEDQSFLDALKPYLQTKRFYKLSKAIGKDAINCGIGWLYVTYDERGEITLKRIRPTELIPEWHDAEHTILDAAIRFYVVKDYSGREEKLVTKVEVYDTTGVYYFYISEDGQLVPEEPFYQTHFKVVSPDGLETGYNWDRIPLVPFRYNAEEIPLITRCKSLQDGLNRIESQWQDQMEEDSRNTILVLVNYDGENLGEFRRNLATYGAVKVRSSDGANGDVRTLQIQVNAENYKAILAQFKKSIIENCMGYDAKDDRLGGNANEMNIKSMYSDIELDANSMETEFQAGFEQLVWFLSCHLSNIKAGEFDPDEFNVEFNRSIMISEAEAIANCRNSSGQISDETILAHHPWVDDVKTELEKLKAQKEEELDMYGGFGQSLPNNGSSPEDEEPEDEEDEDPDEKNKNNKKKKPIEE